MPILSLAVAAVVHFPQWEKVEPETAKKEVPDYSWSGPVGSVLPLEYLRRRPVVACPVVDDAGVTVGFSLSCEGSQK